MDVLVAYESRYGGTREIAERIGRTLAYRGHRPLVRQAARVKDPAPFDAVVLGSAIYEGGWLAEAREMLGRLSPEMPVWLFHSGLLQAGRSPEEAIDAAAAPPGDLDVRGRAVFGGKLEPAGLALDDWLAAPEFRVEAADMRDWEQVDAFAQGIADALAVRAGTAGLEGRKGERA